MPTLYEYETENYGFGVNFSNTNIQLHPKGIVNEVWLELQHSEYIASQIYSNTKQLKYFKIISHRNEEYTKKYKDRAVSKEWVIGYCKHNQKSALDRIEEYKEEVKFRQEQAKLRLKQQEQQKEQEEKAKQQAEANAQEIYKNREKKTGYQPGAEICPKCRGDALRNCNYCDGSGWVSFT